MRIDSEVATVATAENLTLDDTVNGMLRAAQEEVSMEMMKLVISFGGYLNSGDLTSNHLAAVLNVGIGNSVRQKVGLNQIVVSADVPGQWSWVKQWCVFWALKVFYRDAFSRQGGDRYEKKLNFYVSELQRRITPNLWALGIPVVIRPMVRPAALFEVNSGTWDSTNVTTVAGPGTLNDVSLDVAITYADNSQANFYVSEAQSNNCESAPSDTITIGMTTGQVVEVDISTLNPPTGAQQRSQMLVVVVAPLKATVWNVFVGMHGGTLYLQNAVPIPIGVETYTLLGDPVLSGYSLNLLGQYQDRRLSLTPTRQRA